MTSFKDYIAERSKMFAAGIGAAITTAMIRNFEDSFGIDIPPDFEGYIHIGVSALGASLFAYWAPANKPREPKP